MESSTITQTIIDTINTIFSRLFSSVDNSLYKTLDEVVFVDSSIIKEDHFKYLFGSSSSNGILMVVNSLLIGFVLYYIIKHYLSILTMNHNDEQPLVFVFKLILCGIAMNCSYFILEQCISIFDTITSAILYIGKNFYGTSISFSNLILRINQTVTSSGSSFDTFSIDGIVKTTLSISLISLLISYSYRYVLMKLFAILTPFAFLCMVTKSTTTFTKLWFKNFFSLLFIQIITAIVLNLLFILDFNTIASKFIYLGGIYTLIKANSISSSLFGTLTTNISTYLPMSRK